MNNNIFSIIEIGSNNTKTHIYENGNVIFESTTTIEFKKNYAKELKIIESDLQKLHTVIKKAISFTKNVHIYGCSIFRNISQNELQKINNNLSLEYNLKIEVVSQEDEAMLTANGCYGDIDYNGTICVFIGGGGSTELIFVNNSKIIEKKYYDFGVVDITKKFDGLKKDIPDCTFDEVYNYVDLLIKDLEIKADILILAGGDHLYWYKNAGYKLLKNSLFYSENKQWLITRQMSDEYDKNALVTSLDEIRQRSDNPLWFDGSRAMKVITNLISHKVDAKYIIPTKINMEDGLKNKFI